MEMYVSGALALSYFGFVFFAEQMNPLKKPYVTHYRRRWKFACWMAATIFFSAMFSAFLYEVLNVGIETVAAMGLLTFSVLWAGFSTRYRKPFA